MTIYFKLLENFVLLDKISNTRKNDSYIKNLDKTDISSIMKDIDFSIKELNILTERLDKHESTK